MKLDRIRETAIDWSQIEASSTPGTSGVAEIRAWQAGEAQLRVVDYGAGYLADHWCSKGHIIYVIAGALSIEHEDGTRENVLEAGMSWCVGDGEAPAHRVRSESGARVFILDRAQ